MAKTVTMRGLEPLVRRVAREVARTMSARTPSIYQFEEIAWRLRRVQIQVNHVVAVVDRAFPTRGRRRRGRGKLKELPRTCLRRGCQRPAIARGLCKSHYATSQERLHRK